MARLPSFSEIGGRVKSLREQKGLSQGQLAALIDVSRPVVTKIEGGKKAINSLELRRIADVLGVSVDELTCPVNEEEETLMGRFRARQNGEDPILAASIEKIEGIFKEILGQVRLWRENSEENQ